MEMIHMLVTTEGMVCAMKVFLAMGLIVWQNADFRHFSPPKCLLCAHFFFSILFFAFSISPSISIEAEKMQFVGEQKNKR